MIYKWSSDVIAFYSSDERLKQNIGLENPIDGGEMKGCHFEWNDKQNTYESGTD